MTDPSGSCTEWKAAVVGASQKEILASLEKEFDEKATLEEV
jgi:20S proteasome alpha/beta subunit